MSDTEKSIADMREEYKASALHEADANADPLQQFEIWFEQARQAKLLEANSMVLSTINAAGSPTARVVLLKGLEDKAFTFFTNYDSAKGKQILANPSVSLVFLWQPLERQVRIEGRAEKIDAPASDAYFASRPVGSQLGAWASPQSEVITRDALELRLEQIKKEHGDSPPRPPYWGGYRVVPTMIEFWQGRHSRLHDRLRYQRENENAAWQMDRLGP